MKEDKHSQQINMELTRRKFLGGVGALGAAAATPLLIFPENSHGGSWPERPITAVIMYGAGGGTDTIIRTLATEMAKSTGWRINPVNKPGAVGGVATSFTLKKPHDGYWWLGAANYNKFVRVMGHSDSKPWVDWQYFQAANGLASWSVRPDSPFKSFDDVVKAAKKNPGKITISTSGTGGLWHELAATVALAAGIELKYVPYKGGKAAALAGLQGEVDIAGGGVHEHIEFIRAGKFRNLQQTAKDDLDVPGYGKLKSIGNIMPSIRPMLPVGSTYNLAVRRNAPVEVLQEIKKAFVTAANSSTFGEMMQKKFFQIDIRTGEAADRRAAQLECITAATFVKLQKQIGKKVRGPKELGLPEPKDFDSWWPPKGYKPRIS